MKKLFFILLIPFFGGLTSCTKSVDNEVNYYTTTTEDLGSSFLEKNLDSTYLTIQLTPVLTCYSYIRNSPAKPCEVLVKFTCDLTKPLQSYLRIQIQRTIQPSGGLLVDPDQIMNDDLYIMIAPNTQHVVLSSIYVNGSTSNVSDIYKIGTIEFLPQVH